MCCPYSSHFTDVLQKKIKCAGGSIIGFKKLKVDRPYLKSPYQKFIWKPGWNYPHSSYLRYIEGIRAFLDFPVMSYRTWGLHIFTKMPPTLGEKLEIARVVVRAGDVLAYGGVHALFKKVYLPAEEYERLLGIGCTEFSDEKILAEVK